MGQSIPEVMRFQGDCGYSIAEISSRSVNCSASRLSGSVTYLTVSGFSGQFSPWCLIEVRMVCALFPIHYSFLNLSKIFFQFGL